MYVGEVYCGEVGYEAGKVIYEIECDGAVGGSVKVVQNDNPLTLCEVQVIGAPSDEIPLTNIASGLYYYAVKLSDRDVWGLATPW